MTASKNTVTVKWKKQTKQTAGYEIQYSTSSKFTKKTTKTVKAAKKNSMTSKKITKLKAKKKYYVRIRTYQTVKVGEKIDKDLCQLVESQRRLQRRKVDITTRN
ncbi:MAG: fibronectin type III domain-containing protein [Roseburia sp.]